MKKDECQKKLHFDVVIIGAGIVGLASASQILS